MMNFFKKALWMTAGASSVLIGLEVALSFLLVSQPTDLSPGFGAGEAALHKPNQTFVYSRDWDLYLGRKSKINKFGFHGHCVPRSGSSNNIFIMGDSYTEAIMLSPEKSLGQQMADLIPSFGVCAAGMSGASASEYLSQLDHLSKRWEANILVFSINRADFIESFNSRDGMAKFTTADNNVNLIGASFQRPKIIREMYASSLFRYVYYNLDLKRTAERFKSNFSFKEKSLSPITQSKLEYLATKKFFEILSTRNSKHQKIIFLINDTIKEKGSKVDALDVDFWNDFIQRTTTDGYSFVRTSDIFSSGHCGLKSCYLFRDGHWSAAGHSAIASTIRDLIIQSSDTHKDKEHLR
jgi:hypothetical protein